MSSVEGGAEDAIEESKEESKQQTEEKEPEDLGSEFLEERWELSRDQYVELNQADQLSEAAFDLGFGAVEALFCLAAMVMLIISVTTSFSGYSTAGALVLVAGVFETIKQFIKHLDKYKKL